MGRLIEGLWDCSYCSTKGNRGSIRDCPNCGRPRDENTKFYMPGTTIYVSEEKAKTINRNPDWICPYCDSLNSDFISNCESCGSARTEENLDYFSIKEQAHSTNSSSISEEPVVEIGNSNYNTKQTEKNNIMEKLALFPDFVKKYWKYMVAIPLILAIIIGMVYLLIPKNEEITITGFEWERSIEVEKYQTVNESSWSLPTGARLQETRTEISHYVSVIDHYETKTRQVAKQRISGYETVYDYIDLGNGYFEERSYQIPVYETYYETETYQEPVYRDEPVYAIKYYYEIDKWLYERTISTSELNQNPYWGETNLGNNERIFSKTEKYYIIGINSKGKERTIALDYEDWIKLSVNQTVKLKASIFGEGELIE